ncbi:SelT/SelW/SelH family protein [Streptomyces sp. NPDC048566]|uniref:SelT/SelW/SelH family protein n=1 Tax=Streptomyces sp. NPDC048566 TaxID=3365569 RepID=UPI003714E245
METPATRTPKTDAQPGDGRPTGGRRVQIEYCTQCRWLPRAAWLAQELLTTFEAELEELSLKPGTGGVFVVRVGGEVVWDRRDQGFPEPTAVKRVVRDRLAPGMSLGHADRSAG